MIDNRVIPIFVLYFSSCDRVNSQQSKLLLVFVIQLVLAVIVVRVSYFLFFLGYIVRVSYSNSLR